MPPKPPAKVPAKPDVGMFRKQLRVSRRTGDVKLADQICQAILDRIPQDRRAIAVRCWLAQRQGKLDGVEAGLVALGRCAEARGLLRDRNRLALRRAFRHAGAEEQGHEPGAFAEVLEQATAMGDAYAVFRARQGLSAAAVRGGDPAEAEPAFAAYLGAARAAGHEPHALFMLGQVATGPSEAAGVAARLLWRRALALGEIGTAIAWFGQLCRHPPAHGPEDFAAEAQEAKSLELYCIARGLWADLAVLYRTQADTLEGAAKADRLAALAELLEDELGLTAEATRAYGEAATAGLASAAREEQRLLVAAGGGLEP